MISPVGQGHSPTTRSHAHSIEIPLKGMKNAKADLNDAAIKIAGGDVSVDSFVKMMGATYTFEANAKVFKVMDETQGTLLDTLA
ncbi:MAG: hypothetical protein MI748_16895 [Opitutales bacterium]|nr:hypothetical protein [Opitutales bacterium]